MCDAFSDDINIFINYFACVKKREIAGAGYGEYLTKQA